MSLDERAEIKHHFRFSLCWLPVLLKSTSGGITYQERYHQRVKQSCQPTQTIFLVQKSHLVFLFYQDFNLYDPDLTSTIVRFFRLRSWINYREFEIVNTRSWLQDRQFKIVKSRSWSWDREFKNMNSRSWIRDQKSKIVNSASCIQDHE